MSNKGGAIGASVSIDNILRCVNSSVATGNLVKIKNGSLTITNNGCTYSTLQ